MDCNQSKPEAECERGSEDKKHVLRMVYELKISKTREIQGFGKRKGEKEEILFLDPPRYG